MVKFIKIYDNGYVVSSSFLTEEEFEDKELGLIKITDSADYLFVRGDWEEIPKDR